MAILIRVEDALTGLEVLSRWAWVPEEHLAAMVDDDDIQPYWAFMEGTAPDGSVYFLSNHGVLLRPESTEENKIYDWGCTFFRLEDVLRIEENSPELTWSVAYFQGPPKMRAGGGANSEGLSDNGEHPLVSVGSLREVHFEQGHNGPVHSGPPEHLEIGKARKTAEAWGRHLETSLALAVYVIEQCAQGHPPFTKDSLDKACGEMNHGTLTDAAMTSFRNTLSAKYINFGGRPLKE